MEENQKVQEIINRGMEEYFKLNPLYAVLFGKDEFESVVESGRREHLEKRLKWFTQ